MADTVEALEVEVHTEFRHDCSDFPEGFKQHITFLPGVIYRVPKDIGEYFIRAGWASLPGEVPIEVDPNKPVLVQPDSTNHSHAGKGAK